MDKVVPLYVPAPYQDSAESGRLILRDGSTATVRLSTPSDTAAITDLFHRLSDGSASSASFQPLPIAGSRALTLCSSHPGNQLTLVVSRINEIVRKLLRQVHTSGNRTRLRNLCLPWRSFQGKGIGATCWKMALLAPKAGFTVSAGSSSGQPRNDELFRHSGLRMKETLDAGTVEIDFSVQPTEQSVASSEIRDRVVTAASLRWFFKPNGVAVLGASREPSSIGYRFWKPWSQTAFRVLSIPSIPRRRWSVRCAPIHRSPGCRSL